MLVAMFLIGSRVKPLYEFALLLFLIVGVITFTNGEIVMGLMPASSNFAQDCPMTLTEQDDFGCHPRLLIW